MACFTWLEQEVTSAWLKILGNSRKLVECNYSLNIFFAVLGGVLTPKNPKKSQKNPIPIYRFWCSDWDFLGFFGFFWDFLGFFWDFLGFLGFLA